MSLPAEGTLLASDLLVVSLDLVFGGNTNHVDVDEALPIEDTHETARADALDTLLGFTTALLNNEHALRCPADQPPVLIRTIHAVTCPDCVPGALVGTAIRYARRPTRYAYCAAVSVRPPPGTSGEARAG